MVTTPRPLIRSVLRSVCGRKVERVIRVPSPEVLGVQQVDHDGELQSFSIQRLVHGRSLDELAGDLPASDLERLVMDRGELLARVHSIVPDRGIRHELQPPDERFVRRVTRVVDQARRTMSGGVTYI